MQGIEAKERAEARAKGTAPKRQPTDGDDDDDDFDDMRGSMDGKGGAEGEGSAAGGGKEEQQDEEEEEDDDDDETEYLYDLSGVLIHSGVAQGGHYYSFIKDGKGGRCVPGTRCSKCLSFEAPCSTQLSSL